VNRTSGTVVAIGSGTVDVEALGGVLPGLRYPAWYRPALFDSVIVDWLNQQPYVAEVFAGTLVSAVSSYATGLSYSSPHTARGTAAPSIKRRLASAPGAAVFDGLYGTSGWTPGALPSVFPVSQGQVSNLPLLFLTAK
jgi:hypothetical protein